MGKRYKWYKNGRLVKETVDPEGEKLLRVYLSNDYAISYSYGIHGKISVKIYTFRNRYHRLDGPAVVFYHDNGVIEEERYLKNGEYHREDGPAIIEYDTSGNVKRQTDYENGTLKN